MMRLEGGGDQQVVSGRQREALRDLPGVYVGAAASLGGVVAEEILAGLVFIFWSLDADKLNQILLTSRSVKECLEKNKEKKQIFN